ASINDLQCSAVVVLALIAMPRRDREKTRLQGRLFLVAAAATVAAATATTAAGRWPPGSTAPSSSSSRGSSTLPSSAELAAAPAALYAENSRPRRGWGAIPRSLTSGRRRGPERHPSSSHHDLSGNARRCFPHDTAATGSSSSCTRFAPVWVRARGGAVGKRAVGGKRATPVGQAQEEDGEAEEEAPAEEED
ncbi:unnamed protein product, partial [Ectocarpus fasciculatus]